jgi:hypothetical protein
MKYYGKPSLNKVFENGLPGQNFPRDPYEIVKRGKWCFAIYYT